ncbi:MAG: hypothetical protein P8M80_08790 [Pirellulaceae bacterium]|nr:hypothetical protein [Pirellulaceae bacterium]
MNSQRPVWIFTFCFLAFSSACGGDERIVESFEGIEPSWSGQTAVSDFQLLEQSRSQTDYRSGSQSEFLHFKTGRTDPVRFIHAIPHAQLIRDFCPSLWVKSSIKDVQLSVRVVLPRTKNPTGKGPLLLIIPLTRSKAKLAWEKLKVSEGEIYIGLERRLRSLQFQNRGLQVDLGDAYCDLIILDSFQQGGIEYRLWVDDLAIKGFLPVKKTRLLDATQDLSVSGQLQRIAVQGNHLTTNDKPVFLRTVTYQGEPFSVLKNLGFNAVLLSVLPNQAQLNAARKYRIWILCPPPLADPKILNLENSSMIFAWNLGSDLTASDLPMARQQLRQIREIDRSLDRPIFCHAFFPRKKYAELVEIQRLDIKTTPAGDWQSDEKGPADPFSSTKPFLANIQTQVPAEVIDQGIAFNGKQPPSEISCNRIESQIYQSINRGARGFILSCSQNLQTPTTIHNNVANVIHGINLKLMQIEPWLAGGTVQSKVQNGYQTTLLSLNESDVFIAKAIPKSPGAIPNHNGRQMLEISSGQQSPRIYEIDSTGIVPVKHSCENGRVQVEVRSGLQSQHYIISEHLSSLQYLQQTTDSVSRCLIITAEFEALQVKFQQTQFVVEALANQNWQNVDAFVGLQEADQMIRTAESMLNQNHFSTASSLMSEIDHKLSMIRRLVSKAVGKQDQRVTAFNRYFVLLGTQYELDKLAKTAKWSENLLPSGRLDSLKQLASTGWKQNLNETGNIRACVKLSEKNSNDEEKPLILSAWSLDQSKSDIEVTPIWISSPKIPIDGKNLVRIKGELFISRPITRSTDGLMIIDSYGGSKLALRKMKSSSWEPFCIDRIIPENQRDFQLMFALTGTGEVQLKNIRVHSCLLPVNGSFSSVK